MRCFLQCSFLKILPAQRSLRPCADILKIFPAQRSLPPCADTLKILPAQRSLRAGADIFRNPWNQSTTIPEYLFDDAGASVVAGACRAPQSHAWRLGTDLRRL